MRSLKIYTRRYNLTHVRQLRGTISAVPRRGSREAAPTLSATSAVKHLLVYACWWCAGCNFDRWDIRSATRRAIVCAALRHTIFVNKIKLHTARSDFCVEAPARMCLVGFEPYFRHVRDVLSDVPRPCSRHNAAKLRQNKNRSIPHEPISDLRPLLVCICWWCAWCNFYK